MTAGPDTILLTGLPRSGTTLIVSLLNEFPNTVALAEPVPMQARGVHERARAVGEIEAFIAETRESALTRNEVRSKQLGGAILENFFEPPGDGTRLRKVTEPYGMVKLDKKLTPDFRLVIKHPANFSALADLLAPRHTLFALVRHPLAVLAAWQTVDMPVHHGHMPMAETFSPELTALLAAEPDRIKRQVLLIGWLLGVYSRFSPELILRYEDLVADPVRHLSRLTPHARPLGRTLELMDPATRYRGVDLEPLARALPAITPIAERFYPDFERSLAPWL